MSRASKEAARVLEREKTKEKPSPFKTIEAGDIGLSHGPDGVVIENRLGPAMRLRWDQAEMLSEMLIHAFAARRRTEEGSTGLGPD